MHKEEGARLLFLGGGRKGDQTVKHAADFAANPSQFGRLFFRQIMQMMGNQQLCLQLVQ